MQQEEVIYSDKFDEDIPVSSVSHKEAVQRASQASAIIGDLSGETHDQVYNELTIEGESQTLAKITEDYKRAETPDVVSQIIMQNDPTVAANIAQRYVQEQMSPGEVVKEVTATDLKYLEQFRSQTQLEELKTTLFRKLKSNLEEQPDDETGIDFLKSFAPFFDAATAQENLGSGAGVGSLFLGEKYDRVREEFNNSTVDEKISIAKDLIKTAENGGQWLGTPLSEMEQASYLLEGQDRLDYWLNNIGSLADFVFLGAMPRAVKAMRKADGFVNDGVEPASVVSTTKQSNPEFSQELATQAIQGGDDLAEKLTGTTSAGTFKATEMPRTNFDDKYVEGLSSTVKKRQEELKGTAEDIFYDSASTGGRVSKEQRQAEQAKLDKEANEIGIPFGSSTAKVEQVSGEDYMFLSIPIAKTDNVPFTSPVTAVETALSAGRKYGIKEENITLYRRDPLNNDIVQLTQAEKMKALEGNLDGEYFANIQSFQRYSRKGAELEDGVSKVPKLDKGLTIAGKSFSGFFVDAASHFNSYITKAVSRSADITGATGSKLISLVNKDFINLDNTSKGKVWEAVNKGNKERRYYSEQELRRDFLLNDKEVNAYYSVGRFWDTLWQLDNRTFARTLRDEDYHIISKDNDVLFGKPVKADRMVLDLETSTLKKVTKADDYVYELRSPLKVNGKNYKFVASSAKYGSRRVREDDVVLSKIDGYVKRNYLNDYIVEMKDKDGKWSAVAAGDSIRSAKAWIAEKRDGNEYRHRLAHELSSNELPRDFHVSGRSVERYRGKHLQGIQRTDGQEFADVENPVDAMVSAAMTTANGAVLYDTIKTLKNTFNKQYKPPQGKYPNSELEISNYTKDGKDVTGEAKALYSYIEMMENTSNKGLVNKVYRDVIFNVAELLDESLPASRLAGMTADKFRQIAKVDPIHALRTVPHALFIASAPLRQLVLQHSQLLQLMPLTKRYANPINYVKDISAFRTLLAQDGKKFDKTLKALSKSMNVSEAHLRELVTTFKKSGLMESIDSHQFIEANLSLAGKEMYNKTLTAKAGSTITKAVTAIPTVGQKYGFDVGEMNNLIGTFLVAVERKRGKIDLKTTEGRADIVEDTRRLSWNFNQAGKLEYQQGAISLPMMYAQVPHKAMLSMITGSGVLTRKERIRVASMNFALFGGSAFGIDRLLEQYKEDLNPEVSELLFNGMVNKTLNSVLDGITDEEGNSIDFSGNLSPSSGYLEYILSPIEMVLEGKLSAGGAPFAALGKVGTTMQTTVDILTIPGITANMSELEKGQAVLRNILSVYSGVNHLETMLYQDYTNSLVSLNGTTVGRATQAEIYAKLVGFRTSEEGSVYDLAKDQAKFRKSIEEIAEDRLKKAFDASNKMKAFTSFGEQPADVIEPIKGLANFVEMLPPEARPYAQKYIRRGIARRDELGKSIAGNVMQNNLRYMSQGGDPADLDGINAKLRSLMGTNAVEDRIVNDYLSVEIGDLGEE